MPYPDPDLERGKELLVYDRAMHNYKDDAPAWVEIIPGHFILANEAELAIYRKELEA